tara:strand:- start:231 stop:557 length:327 start_codon:yes stop_codon:yes gene_type:complete
MRAHQVKNSKIINTIEIDSLDAMPNLVEATEGGIGWSYVDGVFTAPADKTDEEVAVEVRTERNAKLSSTDWTGMSDVTMSAEMVAYRQALRDVPAQAGFPNTIDWPEV